ncbi:hypothetical protein M758_8G068500 [Ceratodon purpureus]|nr:hypothetical protein M758_8G068500 [Ceratodon purpureus]
MVTTTFVNKTKIDFKLKEGNAGVYRDLAVLQGVDEHGEPRRPDGQHTVTLDVHATYREYTVVATGQKTKKSRVLVSSDMCQDNSVINIICNDTTGKYETECEPRTKAVDGAQAPNGGQTGGRLSGFVNFLKKLGK